jgi:hypothetical protein
MQFRTVIRTDSQEIRYPLPVAIFSDPATLKILTNICMFPWSSSQLRHKNTVLKIYRYQTDLSKNLVDPDRGSSKGTVRIHPGRELVSRESSAIFK